MDTHEGTGILRKAACSRHPALAPSRFQRARLQKSSLKIVSENIDDLKCVLHEIDIHAPHQALTTRSISTRAPSGSAATPIVVRAGKGWLKYFA